MPRKLTEGQRATGRISKILKEHPAAEGALFDLTGMPLKKILSKIENIVDINTDYRRIYKAVIHVNAEYSIEAPAESEDKFLQYISSLTSYEIDLLGTLSDTNITYGDIVRTDIHEES
jgi:hypothetical protein